MCISRKRVVGSFTSSRKDSVVKELNWMAEEALNSRRHVHAGKGYERCGMRSLFDRDPGVYSGP